jgi:hypothetical protein
MRAITAVIGGIIAGLGLGGGAAAIIESLGVNHGGSTIPIVISGLGLGLGIGLLVASVVQGQVRSD